MIEKKGRRLPWVHVERLQPVILKRGTQEHDHKFAKNKLRKKVKIWKTMKRRRCTEIEWIRNKITLQPQEQEVEMLKFTQYPLSHPH